MRLELFRKPHLVNWSIVFKDPSSIVCKDLWSIVCKDLKKKDMASQFSILVEKKSICGSKLL